MTFDYNCSTKYLNIYKLEHKTGNSKVYMFQKRINGKLYYKRFKTQLEAITFSKKINSSLKNGIKQTINKYLK